MQSDKCRTQQKKQSGRWSREEHDRFMLGLMQHGRNWKKVEDVVGTRSGSQVRSHAQKFFNKLQRDPNDSGQKKQRTKGNNVDGVHWQDNHEQQVSLNDNTDMLRSYDQAETPLQIISLIKGQSVDNRKVNLSSFKKSLQQNQEKQVKEMTERKVGGGDRSAFHLVKAGDMEGNGSTLPTIKEEDPGMAFMSSFKSMNNILSAYQQLKETDQHDHLQDESFLIGLTKKYKKYFSKGGQFEGLIDFGNPHEVAKAAEMQHSVRKKSWTLAEGIEGDEQDLEDIKKRLKENKNELGESGDQVVEKEEEQEKDKNVEKNGGEETKKEGEKEGVQNGNGDVENE